MKLFPEVSESEFNIFVAPISKIVVCIYISELESAWNFLSKEYVFHEYVAVVSMLQCISAQSLAQP